jgi:hypothetical protein
MILDNIKLVEKDITCREDWVYILKEGDGFLSIDEQILWFETKNGEEITIQYSLFVEANSYFYPGDITEPSYTEINVKDFEINIKSVYLNDVDYSVSEEEKLKIESIIKELNEL